MGKLRTLLIIICIQACCSDQDPAPDRRNAIPPCLWCPKKTTTHRTTTHLTSHTTTAQTTAHTNHTTTPHTTGHTNHTSTPHPTGHTNHTSTPHPTGHTNHTSTPHPTGHTNHTSTPHPTGHTNQTSTPHPTGHTNHTSTPHPTGHTNHTSTPHPTAHTNQTSLPVTTMPPSTEYVVNGTAGVCLRMTASFKISYNDTKTSETVNLPEPDTDASGNCSADSAWLTLTFPQGQVTITFRQDTKDNNFFLNEVNITLKSLEPEKFGNSSLKAMVTPLKYFFSCEKVNIQITPNVSLSVMNVKAQAFKLNNGNYGKEMKCSDGSWNMTVPIVVGIVLVVLILIVVIAYIVARQRSHRGYQSL
ncbi:lysosome-associated membrane glycoprotein 1-like [Dendrobates tinctorius]|uniref:lysosome-associated membrane glycoprotein 1-like n=1 Tax=Dendrobates tinctorius TaxID=92724 RepID=UPI003CCA14CB